MPKRKLKLEEAKEELGFDKMFYNGYNKFNIVHSGKYRSGITLEIPQEWYLNKDKKPINPINYREVRELTDGMNIDFDGEASVLLGKYRLSKNGRPVFEITEPKEAKDTMILVSWGGAFNKTRGQTSSYAKETGAKFFTKSSSNGGGMGADYWILPVGFVKDREERDVTDILERLQKEDDEKNSEIDQYLEIQEKERQESIKNKDRIVEMVKPIVEDIKKYNLDFEFFVGDEECQYHITGYTYKKRRYKDSLVEELTQILQEEKDKKEKKDEFIPQYRELEELIKDTELSMIYIDNGIQIKAPNSIYNYRTYPYSQEGFNTCVKYIKDYKEKIRQEQEKARLEMEKLKQEKELKEKKADAKEKGYPTIFKFKNRIGGKTGLSHAFVIEKDGMIREPDHNELRNSNHRYHYNWKNNADGIQEYQQILPGEIIVSYTKEVTATPYVLNVEWADGKASKEQLENICEALERTESFAVDSDGNYITSIKEWAQKAIELKSRECRQKLNIEEIEENDEFLDNIVESARKKLELKGKSAEATELAQKYEEQTQQTEGPNMDGD